MSVIDEVKQKTDIVEIVGQYTALKKAGRNLTALCPFHSERNPSFFVYPEQQSWHCFGACSTGGDVFAFLMKKEGYDFGEALRTLAQRAGVVLPSRAESAGKKEEKEEYYKINETAALYYHNLLMNHAAAEKAREYVAGRGFTQQTLLDFQLGFGPDSWEALKDYLKEKGYSEETMLTAGLVSRSDEGRTYDRFRGKLMFPICDIRGRVTGFGARVLDDSLPKYINSPQTPTFDKSGTIYGINRAAPEIRKQDNAVIMEGYMDVITAHQHGITNTVASMGTAVTETQVNTLKKLSRNLVLALDADAAGEEAMLRTVAYENILNAEIRVIVLPEGKDPDDVLQEGVDVWQGLVTRAVPLIDFMFERVTGNLDLTTARNKSLAVDRLLPVLVEINDPIRQAHYLQKLAGLVRVDMNTIRASLNLLKPSKDRRRLTAVKPSAVTPSARMMASTSREEYALALLLQYPELKERHEVLSPEYFESSENREIFNAWLQVDDINTLKEYLDTVIHEHLDGIINKTVPATRNNVEQRFNDCVLELRKKYLRNLAARRAESGEAEINPSRLAEDVEISSQLRELEALRNRKHNSSYTGKTRR